MQDYSQRKRNGFRGAEERKVEAEVSLSFKRSDELTLLVCVAVNMELYPDFRAAIEIKEIDDRAAKEIFIALEECFMYDESGIDSILDRIKDEKLRSYVAESGTSGEHKSDPRKFMEDGINKIRKKKLEKRLTEITAQMRESERSLDSIINVDELLAEKIIIDSQIRKLEGK